MRKPRLIPRIVDVVRAKGRHAAVRAHFSADSIFLDTFDGDVLRLSRRSYEEVWRRPTHGDNVELVWDGELVASSDRMLDATGHVLWSLKEPYGLLFRLDDRLFCHVGIPSRALAEIDPESGYVLREWTLPEGFLWTKPAPGMRMLGFKASVSEPRTADDAGTIACYDLATERLVWQREYGVDLLGLRKWYISLHPFDNESFLADASNFMRCSLNDGRVLWRVEKRQLPTRHHRLGGRILYLEEDRLSFKGPNSEFPTYLVCIDEATGREIYRRAFTMHGDLQGATMETWGTWHKNRLVIPYEGGHLAIFDTSDGSLLALRRERQSLWSAHEVDGDLLLCTGSGKALIYGPEIWQWE